MTTQEIAQQFVQDYNAGNWKKIHEELYSDDIMSREYPGGEFEVCHGKEELAKKMAWWYENFEEHESNVSDPLVADDYFAVRFTMNVTNKANGQRYDMSELAVYNVKEDKIVTEQFFYSMN